MNIMLFVESLIYAYVPIAHNSIKTWISQPVSSGGINNGNVGIKEMMNFLSTVCQIDLGDYYAAYIAMKERKKDWTAYLSRLQDSLVKRMDEG